MQFVLICLTKHGWAGLGFHLIQPLLEEFLRRSQTRNFIASVASCDSGFKLGHGGKPQSLKTVHRLLTLIINIFALLRGEVLVFQNQGRISLPARATVVSVGARLAFLIAAEHSYRILKDKGPDLTFSSSAFRATSALSP